MIKEVSINIKFSYKVAVHNASEKIKAKLQMLASACQLVEMQLFFFDKYSDLQNQVTHTQFNLLLIGSTDTNSARLMKPALI